MRRVLAALLLCGLGCGAFAAPAAAAAAIVTIDSATADAIDGIVRAEMTRQGANGINLAIGRDGNLIYARGYGYANVANKKPVDKDTIFAIGSITKQFTSALVMLYVQDGKIALDAPVATYLPTIPHAAEVTVRQLLNQTSGYMDFLASPGFAALADKQNVSPAALVGVIATADLAFPPGSRYEYSNTNYALLGMIVEAVGGAPYATLLSDRIAKPLGLTSLSYGLPAGDDVSLGYAPRTSTPVATLAAPLLYAAGALATEPATLVRWDNAFFGDKVVNATSLAFLTTSGTAAGIATKYAAGWVDETLSGHRMIWHNGGVPGFNTRNTVFPADHVQIVVFTNTVGFDEGPIVNRIAARLLGGITDAQIAAADTRPGPGEIPAETQHALDLYGLLVSAKLPRSLLSDAAGRQLTPELMASAAAQIGALGTVDRLTFLRSFHLAAPTPQLVLQYLLPLTSGRFIYSLGLNPYGKIELISVTPG